jgi:hypothetical protein
MFSLLMISSESVFWRSSSIPDLALDGQRRGDDGHGQQPHLLGQLGDDGRCSRARSAAHAGGDEEHLRTGLFEHLTDFGQRLDGRAAAAHLTQARFLRTISFGISLNDKGEETT